MSSSTQGDFLIFILSQPRTGSTLLQRLLGTHPHIHTTAEPWLMLHPLYALRPQGHTADYNATGAYHFSQNFLAAIPDGPAAYQQGLRLMGTHIYQAALANTGKHYFLDKTPRYFFILPELYQLFPQARYIFLRRNPLAVLHSIFDTWMTQNYAGLAHLQSDLQQAPHLLLQGQQDIKGRVGIIHYEALVTDPANTLAQLGTQIDLDLSQCDVQYGRSPTPHWSLGDQKVYQHPSPTTASLDRWQTALHHPQYWRLAHDYLTYLGPTYITNLGYNYQTLTHIIQKQAPPPWQRHLTYSLDYLLARLPAQRTRLARLHLQIGQRLHNMIFK